MAARRVADTYSVFVGQLDPSVTKAELYDLFKGCGEIADLVIMEDQNGIKKNFGFVRYMNIECALKAAEDFHEWPLRGSLLMVDLSRDTFVKLEKEKGVVVKRRPLKNMMTKEASSQDTSTNNSIKDTMYMNRLKDTLSSMNLQYTSGQMNYNRLLNDMGPLSTICQMQFSTLKEKISFQEVSGKIMEKCKEQSSKIAGFERTTEFKKALQIIISEISGMMDVGGFKSGITDIDGNYNDNFEDNPGEGKSIFNQLVVPESVRRIQQLEKYTEPANNQISIDNTEKCLENVPKRELCDAECMTDPLPVTESLRRIQQLEKYTEPAYNQISVNITKNCLETVPIREMCDAGCMTYLEESNVGHCEKSDVLDPAILDYHLSALSQQEQPFSHVVSPEDSLEALYLRDHCYGGVQRTSSRDSSLSADSIDDSGIETEIDNLRMVTKTEPPENRYDCYRAEGRGADGRPRPVDHRIMTGSVRNSSVHIDGLTRRHDEQFSLEDYISKNVGRGRGAASNVTQVAPKSIGGRGIFKL